MHRRHFLGTAFTALLLASSATPAHADPIPVRQTQGTFHGMLLVRSPTGEIIGHGDFIQSVHGSRVTAELALHFRDGSLDDEVTTFTQDSTFRFVSDHHIQRGPFFPASIDFRLDATGQVTNRTIGKDGKEKVETQHIDLPTDVSNGMISNLLVNVRKDTPAFAVSMVLPSGKGRLAKLSISPDSERTFTGGGVQRKATVFRVKIELGGVAGVVAPVIGKQPDDVLIWILEGSAPTLLRVQQQLYEGGPVVSLEMAGTTYPSPAAH